MIVLAGGDIVLPDRVVAGSLLIHEDRIAAIDVRTRVAPAGATVIDASGLLVVPGFIDVHVHGVEGFDTLDGDGDTGADVDDDSAVAAIARRLPRFGVTAFCPTTTACDPTDLRRVLAGISQARAAGAPAGARVLPAHLESNFINPEYRGAQPMRCLRTAAGCGPEGTFTGPEILRVIAERRAEVGIVTVAPELDGGLDLVRQLVASGHRVSLGHSAATFDEAVAAIDAGASHATHLFNRMPPLHHRTPGLAAAVLTHEAVAAELICDGFHVHPAMCRMAIGAKTVDGIMAITDGTAGSGLAVGSTARLGGETILVGPDAAMLRDGTLAGSTLTMDGAFRMLVHRVGVTIVEAARLCASTPARRLGLAGQGVIAEEAVADVVLLDRSFHVVRTFIAGREVFARRV